MGTAYYHDLFTCCYCGHCAFQKFLSCDIGKGLGSLDEMIFFMEALAHSSFLTDLTQLDIHVNSYLFHLFSSLRKELGIPDKSFSFKVK